MLGKTTGVTGVDGAEIDRFYTFRFSAGSEHALRTLDGGGAIVRKSFADKQKLHVGSPLRLTTPSGKTVDLRVGAILDQGKFDLDPMLGTVVMSQKLFDASFPRPADLYTFVNVQAGADALAGQAIAEGAKRYPGVKVSTRDEFVAERVEGIGQILNLLYVLLALSVVVSLFGMVNTLVLAVFERTRELGMLRAIGLTRRQTRRMVRHESVVTALIGAALGLPLGIGLAALVTQALSDYDVAVRRAGRDARRVRRGGGRRRSGGRDHAREPRRPAGRARSAQLRIEIDGVAHVDRVGRERDDASRPVLAPAAPLVEPARAVVVLEHPQVTLLGAQIASGREGVVVEKRRDARSPARRRDVEADKPLRLDGGNSDRPAAQLGDEHSRPSVSATIVCQCARTASYGNG